MLVYNADEMGVSVVHKMGKVLAQCGRRHVYSVASGEKGKTHTILTCLRFRNGVATNDDLSQKK